MLFVCNLEGGFFFRTMLPPQISVPFFFLDILLFITSILCIRSHFCVRRLACEALLRQGNGHNHTVLINFKLSLQFKKNMPTYIPPVATVVWDRRFLVWTRWLQPRPGLELKH